MHAYGRITKITKHMTINWYLASSCSFPARDVKKMLVAQHFSFYATSAGSGNKVYTHITALSLLLPVLQVKKHLLLCLHRAHWALCLSVYFCCYCKRPYLSWAVSRAQ